MKGIHVVVAAVLVAAAVCPFTFGNIVYAQFELDSEMLQKAFDKAVTIFGPRNALPLESVTGEPKRYDLPTFDFWSIVPRPAEGTIEILIDGHELVIINGSIFQKPNSSISWAGYYLSFF